MGGSGGTSVEGFPSACSVRLPGVSALARSVSSSDAEQDDALLPQSLALISVRWAPHDCAAGFEEPWACQVDCQLPGTPRCAASTLSADGVPLESMVVAPCIEPQLVDVVAINPLVQRVSTQYVFYPPATVEDLLWYIQIVLVNEGPLDPLALADTYQKQTGLSNDFGKFLCTSDGPIVMVARLPHTCIVECIEGNVTVSARMSSHTTRLRIAQRCLCYRQSLVDNANGALQSARYCVERVKESLRQREQRRLDFGLH